MQRELKLNQPVLDLCLATPVITLIGRGPLGSLLLGHSDLQHLGSLLQGRSSHRLLGSLLLGHSRYLLLLLVGYGPAPTPVR
jgi:hypothetical protein